MIRNTESQSMRDDDDYESYADEMTANSRKREADDLNYEIAGAETGQQKRFLPESHSPAAQQAKKEKQHADNMTALMLKLLTDPVYKAFYDETMDMLTDAEKAADDAMAYFAMKHVESQKSLQEALANTTILHGHGAVFKDADDNVRTADGTIITNPILLDSIIWKDNSTTYEDFVEKREAVKHYSKSYDDAYTYRNDTLGKVRETMENQDKPVTQDKMEELREVIKDKAPEYVARELTPSSEETYEISHASPNFSIPKFN